MALKCPFDLNSVNNSCYINVAIKQISLKSEHCLILTFLNPIALIHFIHFIRSSDDSKTNPQVYNNDKIFHMYSLINNNDFCLQIAEIDFFQEHVPRCVPQTCQ